MNAEALGRSRGGLTTKIHVVCDGNGLPLGAAISPGQTHDSSAFEVVLGAVPLGAWPDALAGDKGYSAKRIRSWLEKRDIADVIPYKCNEHPPEGHTFDREAYRRRNVVERLIGWLKECRRIATRFEKRGKHFLAMIKLAAMRRLVRVSL
jgi:transposase